MTERASSANPPTLIEEMRLRAQGYGLIAGVDEAGRGPLAGPVVAGAVILPTSESAGWFHLPRDSKALSEGQREKLFSLIRGKAVATGIGIVEAEEIDRMGIGKASLLAMRLAVEALDARPDYALVDAFRIPDLVLPQKGIIRGDSISLSIAAASIIAKVTRDRLLVELDSQYPGYGLARHKGYPTRQHVESLAHLGPSPIHRLSFAPVREACGARGAQEGNAGG